MGREYQNPEIGVGEGDQKILALLRGRWEANMDMYIHVALHNIAFGGCG